MSETIDIEDPPAPKYDAYLHIESILLSQQGERVNPTNTNILDKYKLSRSANGFALAASENPFLSFFQAKIDRDHNIEIINAICPPFDLSPEDLTLLALKVYGNRIKTISFNWEIGSYDFESFLEELKRTNVSPRSLGHDHHDLPDSFVRVLFKRTWLGGAAFKRDYNNPGEVKYSHKELGLYGKISGSLS